MPLGFSRDKQLFLATKDLKTVYRIQDACNPAWISQISTENVSGIMWDSPVVPGYEGREHDLSDIISEKRIKYISMEFCAVSGEDYVERSIPGLLVRGHQINEAELGHNQESVFWLSRWMRAVKERSIRFVYFRFWKNRSIEDNMSYLRSTAKNFKDAGYKLDTANPPDYPSHGRLGFWKICVFLTAVLIPLLGLKTALKRNNFMYSFAAVNAVSLFGGVLISAMLYDAYFMQKMADVPMVRIIFFIPLMLSVFILFRWEQLKNFWNTRLEIKHFIIAAAILAVGAVLLIRSGNNAAEWMTPDQGLREFLENLLFVRPRTKEFLIGHPLLLLGFYLKNPWLILAGMVGQVSVLNTFLHAHSPLAVSLTRTVFGMIFGFIIGVIFIELYKVIRAHIVKK